jgi:hypothetical protein
MPELLVNRLMVFINPRVASLPQVREGEGGHRSR